MDRQDPFGNYVVQYVLELDIAEASIAVMNGLFGHYAELAQQKFSSNVVEKCLKLGGSQLNEVCLNASWIQHTGSIVLILDPAYWKMLDPISCWIWYWIQHIMFAGTNIIQHICSKNSIHVVSCFKHYHSCFN